MRKSELYKDIMTLLKNMSPHFAVAANEQVLLNTAGIQQFYLFQHILVMPYFLSCWFNTSDWHCWVSISLIVLVILFHCIWP